MADTSWTALLLCSRFYIVQVTFGFTSPISWDKSPNKYGQKTIAVDPTGAEDGDEAAKRSSLASVGCHLLMIAVHQRIITLDDLEGLALGEAFTVSQLVLKRKGTTEADALKVDDMCVCFSISTNLPCSQGCPSLANT